MLFKLLTLRLQEIIRNNGTWLRNINEIESCFDLNYYGKSVDEIYKRVFKGEIK